MSHIVALVDVVGDEGEEEYVVGEEEAKDDHRESEGLEASEADIKTTECKRSVDYVLDDFIGSGCETARSGEDM